jgi:flagellar biosynthetic protein FlhB
VQDKHSKTEEASPKRLRDSRKKGQVAKSGDLNSSVSFLAFAILLTGLGQYLFSNSFEMMRATLRAGPGDTLSAGNAGSILMQSALRFFVIFLPFGLVAVVVGIVTNLAQVGFLFTAEPMKPDFKRLNPLEGFKNIFSMKSLVNLVKSILKLVVVTVITLNGMKKVIVPIMNAGQMGVEKLFPFFIDIVRNLSISIASLMIVLGILDYVFQRRDFRKNLMMTKQETKDEYKQMEGDPKIKSLRQQRQRELSMGRTMQQVETASVIIVNPTHLSIALKYELGKDQAPVVVAKGVDHLALKIREKAKELGIPVIEDIPLARAMYYKVEPGSYVPLELYQAVAEILALVYQMEQSRKPF